MRQNIWGNSNVCNIYHRLRDNQWQKDPMEFIKFNLSKLYWNRYDLENIRINNEIQHRLICHCFIYILHMSYISVLMAYMVTKMAYLFQNIFVQFTNEALKQTNIHTHRRTYSDKCNRWEGNCIINPVSNNFIMRGGITVIYLISIEHLGIN